MNRSIIDGNMPHATRRVQPRALGTIVLISATIAAIGCTAADDAGDVDATPPAATTPDANPAAEGGTPATGTTAAVQTCTNETAGFTVDYPADWQTNDGSVMPACSLFDPEPFTIPPATEIPADIAVSISREPVDLDVAGGDDFTRRVLSRDTTQVDGRTAIRLEAESTGEGLYDAGMVTYSYLVDLDGETLIAQSHSAGEPAFEVKKQALDRMMQSLRFIRAEFRQS